MSERMTLKKFDSLKPRDFENGAILDDIRFTVKLCEELYLKWLLHGEGKEEALQGAITWVDNDAYNASTGEYLYTKREPDPWEAWRVDAPDPTNFNRWENWAYNVIKWIITMPRGK